MAGPVSQRNTEWVRAGDMVAGKKVEKGYLAQKGKPEKRVTAKVKLETTVGQGGKTISNVRGVSDYSKGRNVTKPLTGAKQTNPSSTTKAPASPKKVTKTPTGPTGATPNRGAVSTVSSQSKIPAANKTVKTPPAVPSPKADDRSPLQKLGDWAAGVQSGGKNSQERLIVSLKGQIAQKNSEKSRLAAKKNQTKADQKRSAELDAEIRKLKSQL
jgi:hypothetical protein